jgi:hypothetical protein
MHDPAHPSASADGPVALFSKSKLDQATDGLTKARGDIATAASFEGEAPTRRDSEGGPAPLHGTSREARQPRSID